MHAHSSEGTSAEGGMACCHGETPRALPQEPSHDVSSAPKRRGVPWELVVAAVPILLAALVAVSVVRARQSGGVIPSESQTLVGTTVGTDAVADNGAGNVTASATYERAKSSADQIVFTVALNTHSVDLSAFDPANILLRASSSQGGKGTLMEDASGQSSHHRLFQLSFPRPKGNQVTIIVRNVAGIAQRELPFTL